MPEPDRELVARLRLAVARLSRRLRQEAAGEITASQLSALSSLARMGALTLGELAGVERVRPPTMTRIVAQLEEAGLVSRQSDPEDRRISRVSISPAGQRFLESSRSRTEALLARRLASLEPEELAALEPAVRLLEYLLDERLDAKEQEAPASREGRR